MSSKSQTVSVSGQTTGGDATIPSIGPGQTSQNSNRELNHNNNSQNYQNGNGQKNNSIFQKRQNKDTFGRKTSNNEKFKVFTASMEGNDFNSLKRAMIRCNS